MSIKAADVVNISRFVGVQLEDGTAVASTDLREESQMSADNDTTPPGFTSHLNSYIILV